MSDDVAELEREADALPDGWRLCRLGDVATLSGGTTPSRAEPAYWENAAIPWATPSDITSLPAGVSRIADTEAKVSDRALAECSLTLNPPGTVLMTSRATIGFVALNDVPMATNQGFITFRAGDRLDADFLLYWLTAQRGNLVAAAGGSTFKELSRGTAKLLPILIPPLDEQRRIAEVLRSVDEAIAAADATYLQACETLRAARTELVGLNCGKVHWATKRILDCFQLQRGHDLPVQAREHGDVPVIASNGPVGTHNVAAIPGPCVITGRSGTIGKVSYYDGPSWPLNTTLYVKDFRGAYPRFVFHFLSAFPLQDYQSGTGVPTLNRNDVHAVEVQWPPETEQEAIAEALDRLEEAVNDADRSLRCLFEIKKTIMADLLSGRVRVPA